MDFENKSRSDSMACDQQSAAIAQEQHSHQEIAEELLKLDPASQERWVSLKGSVILSCASEVWHALPTRGESPIVSRLHRASSMHATSVNCDSCLPAQAETRGRSSSACGITAGIASQHCIAMGSLFLWWRQFADATPIPGDPSARAIAPDL